MERIILYSESQACGALPAALAERQLLRVASRLELARAVIQSGPVLAVVVCCDTLDESLRRLLASLKRSFPLLNLCLVSVPAAAAAEGTPAWRLVDCCQPPEILAEQVRGFLAAISRFDRRERPRFDWPLQGRLGLPSVDERDWPTHNIWALSADGAFLESPTTPPPGTRATLALSFQSWRLATACEVLDPRRASSRLPAGFAVRFLALPDASRQVLEHLVEDALLATLLQTQPGQDAAPSLGEEELSIGGSAPR